MKSKYDKWFGRIAVFIADIALLAVFVLLIVASVIGII